MACGCQNTAIDSQRNCCRKIAGGSYSHCGLKRKLLLHLEKLRGVETLKPSWSKYGEEFSLRLYAPHLPWGNEEATLPINDGAPNSASAEQVGHSVVGRTELSEGSHSLGISLKAKNIVSDDVYVHFLAFNYFMRCFVENYMAERVSHNVHAILHLHIDAKNYGSLEKISSFKFEDKLQALKKLVRKNERPLPQIVRREAGMGLRITEKKGKTNISNDHGLPMGMTWKVVGFDQQSEDVAACSLPRVRTKQVSLVPQAWLFENEGEMYCWWPPKAFINVTSTKQVMVKDDEVKGQLITLLCLKVGGKDFTSLVNGILSRLMGNAVAEKFNWKGQRGKKYGLDGTPFHGEPCLCIMFM
ncbi:hypothetical protein J437_LFUL015502 [Ladona fulva]|uniref:Uncharacterized protein n=1 Tax=Ladona fulva TaxID=123851 RepID=A0A8K0P8U7_LADFU|nr:hypothetical protein J437_LFUL015502 [Ladona fulva]